MRHIFTKFYRNKIIAAFDSEFEQLTMQTRSHARYEYDNSLYYNILKN